MDLNHYFASRIPVLKPVSVITQADIDSSANRGMLHLMLVGVDATAGLFGARIPCVTISARTAHTLLQHQYHMEGAPAPNCYADVNVAAPLWALALGWALESVDPGHLQAAMQADAARALNAYHYLVGGV